MGRIEPCAEGAPDGWRRSPPPDMRCPVELCGRAMRPGSDGFRGRLKSGRLTGRAGGAVTAGAGVLAGLKLFVEAGAPV